MATRIESVRLEAFRGATAPVSIEFDTSKPIALIFGENGSGKSTIVDAIDFVCNEKYGSLSDRSSANPKTHLHSFGRAPNDLTVSVKAAGKTWTGRLQTQGPQASGPADRPAATENMLIHGDNLLALKALEQDFAGRIKCIYIDPPFNTGQAFEHYDDGLEHSIWLTMMRDRLVLLRALLRPEGTIFVHIDDNELGYLLALMDEIFGRRNFVAACTFKQGAATGHKAINPGLVTVTNFVLVYAKDKSRWQCNRLFISRERDRRYTQFILNRNAPYPEWAFTTLRRAFAQSLGLPEREAKNQLGADYEERLEGFVLQNAASVIRTARPDYEGVGEAARAMIDRSKGEPTKVLLLQRDAYPDMYFLGGERILFYADKLKKIDGQLVPGEPLTTLWDDVLSNNLHNEGGVDLNRTT